MLIKTRSLYLTFAEGDEIVVSFNLTCLPSINFFKKDRVNCLIFSAKKISTLFPLSFVSIENLIVLFIN